MAGNIAKPVLLLEHLKLVASTNAAMSGRTTLGTYLTLDNDDGSNRILFCGSGLEAVFPGKLACGSQYVIRVWKYEDMASKSCAACRLTDRRRPDAPNVPALEVRPQSGELLAPFLLYDWTYRFLRRQGLLVDRWYWADFEEETALICSK